jgi:hypothetical protein
MRDQRRGAIAGGQGKASHHLSLTDSALRCMAKQLLLTARNPASDSSKMMRPGKYRKAEFQ